MRQNEAQITRSPTVLKVGEGMMLEIPSDTKTELAPGEYMLYEERPSTKAAQAIGALAIYALALPTAVFAVGIQASVFIVVLLRNATVEMWNARPRPRPPVEDCFADIHQKRRRSGIGKPKPQINQYANTINNYF